MEISRNDLRKTIIEILSRTLIHAEYRSEDRLANLINIEVNFCDINISKDGKKNIKCIVQEIIFNKDKLDDVISKYFKMNGPTYIFHREFLYLSIYELLFTDATFETLNEFLELSKQYFFSYTSNEIINTLKRVFSDHYIESQHTKESLEISDKNVEEIFKNADLLSSKIEEMASTKEVPFISLFLATLYQLDGNKISDQLQSYKNIIATTGSVIQISKIETTDSEKKYSESKTKDNKTQVSNFQLENDLITAPQSIKELFEEKLKDFYLKHPSFSRVLPKEKRKNYELSILIVILIDTNKEAIIKFLRKFGLDLTEFLEKIYIPVKNEINKVEEELIQYKNTLPEKNHIRIR
jgi:transcription termination factor NusB